MKKVLMIISAVFILILMFNKPECAYADDSVFFIDTGTRRLKVLMEENSSTAELRTMLAKEDIRIEMSENGGFEQYGDLGKSIASDDRSINGKAGDVLLYDSRYICVFYGSNTYSYSRIGRIQDADESELKELLSGTDMTITLTLSPGADSVSRDGILSDQNGDGDPLSGGEGGNSGSPGETTDGNKTIVVWFSAQGHTKAVAQKILEASSADEYEIVPAIPYTEADLNYNSDTSRANIEQNNGETRPAISGTFPDLGKYDTILLGYPIWWGKAPKVILTFLENYDLTDKTIIPFCTSGSSGIEGSLPELQTSAKGAKVEKGKRFAAGVSARVVAEWVGSLELPTVQTVSADVITIKTKIDIGRFFDLSGYKKHFYTVSAPKLATVSGKGVLKAKKPGEFTVSVYGGDNRKSGILVGKRSFVAQSPALPKKKTAAAGEKIPAAQLLQGTSLTPQWTSKNENVAKINSETGEIEVLQKGSTVITAIFSNGYKCKMKLKVM